MHALEWSVRLSRIAPSPHGVRSIESADPEEVVLVWHSMTEYADVDGFRGRTQ